MKKGGTFILALSLPKEDTTRNQWLSCIYNTVPEQFNQIFECVQHILRRTVSWIWKSNVSLQCRLLKDCFYKAGHFQLCKDSLCFWLTACNYVFLFKECATDDSLTGVLSSVSPITNADVVIFTQCDATWHVKRQYYKSLQSVIMSPLDATKASFIMGFIVFVSSHRDTAPQYGEERNVSVSRLRHSANHNGSLESWPIRARLTSQNDELSQNWPVSERQSNNNVQYVENNVFSNLKPHKHIELHQIHKTMFFLAASYDPFKAISPAKKAIVLVLGWFCFIDLTALVKGTIFVNDQSTFLH